MFKIQDSIIKKYNVSEDNLNRIKKVWEYDFSFLTKAFNDDLIKTGRIFSVEQVYPIIKRFGKADYEIAKLLEDEFKKFVILTLITPGKPHAPSGSIDMYWHFFILHTEEYIQFCEQVWGDINGNAKFRNHYPANDQTRPGMLQSYIDTLELYKEVFGEPTVYNPSNGSPITIWNKSDTCGDSYSGIVPVKSLKSDAS